MSKVSLFISYSHRDGEKYLPELLTYLNDQTCPRIDVWYDERISPGSEWDDAIKRKMDEADIVLLLLSQSFLMSKYIRENELSVALERHKAGACKVIPIFLRNCFLDNYPQIKALQGLPRDMRFLSDMGEERFDHYTHFVEVLNDIAYDLETDRSITDAKQQVNGKAAHAREIDDLSSKRKIFLSLPDTEEGRKKRKDFIIQVEGKIKYEEWPYEVVPGIQEAAALYKLPEAEMTVPLKALIGESLYSIHIVTSESDLAGGIGKMQYELAKQQRSATFFKSIVWLLDAGIKNRLDMEVSMNPVTTGNDYDNIFELIRCLDTEKDKMLVQMKKNFAPKKKVYMFYDFRTDHNNELRIQLKSKIEENENLTVRFSLPDPLLEKEREDLDKCEGGCIFYGATDPRWFAYRQSLLLDAGYTHSKAVCVDEPEIDKKIQRDLIKNAFTVIRGQTGLDLGLKNFLDQLNSTL